MNLQTCKINTFYSKDDFQLKALALQSGCISNTLQSMGSAIYLDDRGLTRLDRVQNFGDFDSAAISQKVQPLLLSKVLNTRCSIVMRGKNQYRLFFGDQTVLAMTMYGNEVQGFSELRYNFVANCTFSGEDTDGRELFFVGGVDGYVYQLERGNSFDGVAYASTFQTGFMSFGQAEYKKRWRKMSQHWCTAPRPLTKPSQLQLRGLVVLNWLTLIGTRFLPP